MSSLEPSPNCQITNCNLAYEDGLFLHKLFMATSIEMANVCLFFIYFFLCIHILLISLWECNFIWRTSPFVLTEESSQGALTPQSNFSALTPLTHLPTVEYVSPDLQIETSHASPHLATPHPFYLRLTPLSYSSVYLAASFPLSTPHPF